MRVFKPKWTRTKNGVTTHGRLKKWYCEYKDHAGITRRVAGYADRQATTQMAAELERQAARRQSGLIDRFDEHQRRPLMEHVADWKRSLQDKDATERYVRMSESRVIAVLRGSQAVNWSDLDANRVASYLADRREAGLSVESSNHYLRRIKQFARWMAKSKRAPDSPLDCLSLQNSRADQRRVRRAITDNELRSLLSVTRAAPVRFGMAGTDRAVLYQLAVESGLRSSELRSLTWSSFALDDAPPTVTVGAAYSKHRRDDTLPLKVSTAQMLARWRDERTSRSSGPTPFGTMPEVGIVAKMLRADLEAAGIEYRDDAGRVLDFHSLRHSFISSLARGGVHPKVAQQLARHSTITLTMDRYSHVAVGQLSEALDKLPDLSPQHDEQRTRATGTDDRVTPRISSGISEPLASRGVRLASGCMQGGKATTADRAAKPLKTRQKPPSRGSMPRSDTQHAQEYKSNDLGFSSHRAPDSSTQRRLSEIRLRVAFP